MSGVPERLTQALAGHYRLERELGRGGMATVYLAQDLKHEREVAVKVLRPELGALLGAERFLAEIKITARLDHPHILTLIDSGSVDGLLYYVLPYVRGESLRDRLTREKQLGLEEALAITRQVAGALDYAHRQGVIHRDIKPENILLQEGEAMLADFGIALAVREAGGNRLTETGLSLGTPQYMSPEQATGDRQLDARSDVYSLAAVLYEMLTGEPPVTGATAQAMIAKLMTERPTRVRTVRDTVPPGIDDAVAKALSKVPADRFPGTAEFAAALVAGSRAVEPGRRWPLVAAASGVVLLGAVAWSVLGGRGRSAPSPLAVAVPAQFTTSGQVQWGDLSRDGRLVAVSERVCATTESCRTELRVRELDGEGVSTLMADSSVAAFAVAWSPDARYVLVATVDPARDRSLGMYLVPQRGGTPRFVFHESYVVGGFVAPDTIVLAPFEGEAKWLRRIALESGQVVDSIRLPVGAYLDNLRPSHDGRFLLATHYRHGTGGQVLVLDREGRVLDSLNADAIADWAGTGEVMLSAEVPNDGRAFIRRQVDRRGRFTGSADTVRVIEERAGWAAMGPGGNVLVYAAERLGEVGLWTATRRDARGEFERGRRVGTSTGRLTARLSPGGGWLAFNEGVGVAGDERTQLSVEPFAGGPRTPIGNPETYDYAFAPTDDTLAVLTTRGANQLDLTLYPLPTGRPIRLGPRPGEVIDAEWLADGSMTQPRPDRRAILVYERSGTVREIPMPEAVGDVESTGRAPGRLALAVTGRRNTAESQEGTVSWVDITSGAVTLVARMQGAGLRPGVWWTTDGFLHVVMRDLRNDQHRLHRVPVTGGVPEAEPAITFEPDARVVSLSHDGRRAVVEARRVTRDIWVLRGKAAP